MKKIKDERLILQNLKNIRTAFIVQTIGIIGILFYQAFVDGIMSFTKNPLWMLLLVVGVVLSYQNLTIANDMEDERTNPGPYYRVLILSVIIGGIMGLLVKFFPGDGNPNALLAGMVVFFCFLIPFSVVHFLLKKRLENDE